VIPKFPLPIEQSTFSQALRAPEHCPPPSSYIAGTELLERLKREREGERERERERG